MAKIAPPVARSPDFAILTKNEHKLFTSFSQSHKVFVIVWSKITDTCANRFWDGGQVYIIRKWDLCILILPNTLHFSTRCPILLFRKKMTIPITPNLHILTTFVSYCDQMIIHTCVNQILGLEWGVFNEIMGPLHPYITKIALFVAKSPDFATSTKNDLTMFTILLQSHQCFL